MDKIKSIGFKAGDKPRRPVIQADTSASKSYANIAYGVSEGEIVGLVDGLKSIYLDGTPVMSSAGDYNIPDVTVQTRNGTNSQEALEGFPAVVNEKNYNNLELKSDAPFVHYINDTQLDAVGVRITFGQIQQGNPDNGDVGGYTIKYAIDVQTDGQGYKELLQTEIVGKYASGYQRYHRIELPDAEEGWEVRVRRITQNSTSSYIADKMYIDAMAEILDVKMRYPNTALIGLKYDSERFNNIPKVDFRMRGKIIRVPTNYNPVERTYATTGAGTTNGVWDGSFKMAYTSNPAWIFYDIVLSKRYGLGNRIDASMLDKWSLYSIARYCDVMVPDGEGGMEPRFTCNVYLNNRYEAYDCLMQLSGVFRGIMYWSGTSIIAGCDRPQDPVYTYTRANVLGEFNYSATRARDRHSVALVAFDDPSNNYKTDKEIVSDRKAIAEIGVRQLDMSAFACTSRGQAQRAGKWALLKEQLETRLVSFAVGLDGYIAPVGKVIEIADPLLAGRALGGRIAAVSADNKTITLDRDLTVKVGDRLVLNNEEGEQESRQVTSIEGRAVTVAVAFESPAVQNVWAVESDDLMLMKFTVLSVTENSSQDGLNFTITALQHEPELHAAADYSSYIDKSDKYSVIDIHTQKPPTNVVITSENRINQGIDITSLVISWKQAENAVKYQVQWRRDSGNWIQTPMQYGNQLTIDNVYHGTYEARVVAINAMEVNSTYANSAPTLIASKFAEPQTLATFTATGILFGITLDWRFPAIGAANAAYVEVHQAFNSNYSDSALLGSYAYPTDTATYNGLGANLTIHFKARLIDRNGVASEFTPWISATVRSDPDQLLEILNGHIGLAAIDEELSKELEDTTAGVADAKDLANQAKTAAANAQTTATNAGAAASDAAGKAAAAANAVAKEAIDRAAAVAAETTARNAALTKEATDRAAAITAEAKARTDGLAKEATDRAAAVNVAVNAETAARTTALTKEATDRAAAIAKESTDRAAAIAKEATDRATALNTQATTLKADSAAKVKALKDEVDPKIVTLQDGITKVTTDYKAGDTAVVGQLNAYKASNDTAVASVVQKAESAVATGATNSTAITAINGQITNINNNKLDASVITGYYTKGQTDAKAAEIAAGKVEEFSANLKIGGANLFPNSSDQWQSRTFASWQSYFNDIKIGEGEVLQVGDTIVWSAYVNDDTNAAGLMAHFVVPKEISSTQYIQVQSNFIEAGLSGRAVGTAVIPVGATAVRMALRHRAGDAVSSVFRYKELQVEKGNVPTAWSPSIADTQASIDANSTAIQTTDAEVRRVDGKVEATNSAVTTLTGRISTVEGDVAKKADASALTTLTTRVATEEGKSLSQGNAITALQNTINHATTGLATKASTSALTSTNSEVSRVDGVVKGHTNQLTQLSSDIITINNGLATKLDSSVINNYYTKSQTDAKAESVAAGKVEEYDASLVIGGTNLFINSTLTGDLLTYSNQNRNTILSQKYNELVYVPETGTNAGYIFLINGIFKKDVKYVLSFTAKGNIPFKFDYIHIRKDNGNTSGTSITPTGGIQVGTEEDNYSVEFTPTADDFGAVWLGTITRVLTDLPEITLKNIQVEQGTKATAWSPSPEDVQSALEANSTSIQTTNAEVTRVDGVATAANNATTALAGRVSTIEGSVATKAEAAALTALTTRVSNTEGVNTSQGSAITSLENSVNHATTGLASKASSQALTAVDNKVTAANGRIDTTNSDVTKLTGRVSTVEGDITKKADASALTALTTRVGNAEGVNTSQGSAITTLQNTVNHATTGLATKASTSALTATNSEVSRVNDVVIGHTNQLTQLESDITTINGTLATKANASALNEYLTKTQTNSAIAASTNALKASLDTSALSASSNNLWEYVNTTDTKPTVKQGDYTYHVAKTAPYSGARQVTSHLNLKVGQFVVVSFKCKVLDGVLESVGTHNGAMEIRRAFINGVEVPKGSTSTNGSSVVPVSNIAIGGTLDCAFLLEVMGTGVDSISVQPNRPSSVAVTVLLSHIQLELGSERTAWKPSLADVTAQGNQLGEKASSESLQATNTEVSRVNGQVVAQGTSIDQLKAAVTNLNTETNTLTEAAATAQTTANTAVTDAASAANRVTTLDSNFSKYKTANDKAVSDANAKINTVESTLTKADSAISTRVDTLTSTVNANNTAVNSRIDSVNTTVSNNNTALANRATTLEASMKIEQATKTYIVGMHGGSSAANRTGYTYQGRIVTATGTAVQTFGRGLNVMVVGNDNSISNYNRFDVYGNDAAVSNTSAQAMADWLNAQEIGTRVLIVGHDNIRDVGTGTNVAKVALREALADYGFSPSFIAKLSGQQLPIMLGRKGADRSGVLEVMCAGTSGNDWIQYPLTLVAGSPFSSAAENYTTRLDLEANANSINTTNTEVTRVNGELVAQGESINKLQSDLQALDTKTGSAIEAVAVAQSTANTAVTNDQATAQSLAQLKSTYEAKLPAVDKVITDNASKAASDLATAKTTLANADTALGTRIDTLTTTVGNNKTASEASIKTVRDSVATLESATNTKIDGLKSSLATTDANVAKKFDATNISKYSTTAEMNTAISSSTNTLAASLQLQGNNLVADGGFENFRGTTGGASTYTGAKHSGTRSVRISRTAPTNSGGNNDVYFGDYFVTSAERIYYVEYYARKDPEETVEAPAAASCRIGINFNTLKDDGTLSNSWLSVDVKPATLTDTWVKVSGYITAPANAYRGRLWTAISASTNHPQGMSFLIDDIFIMDVTEGRKGVTGSDANAAAISTTNTEVSRINDVVSGHVTDISNLTTSIAGKADASALNSLTARVATEEGKSTSQGTALTNLENAVNHSTTGLASKASSSALTTLNNQVQHSTTGLSAVNTKVDNLKATIENTTNGLASKASSSALDTLSNKVNHSTTGLDAIASKTTVLESDVAKALDVVTISDTRSTNQPPSWYWANYSKRTVNEFKTQTVIGVDGFFGGTYCNLETNIPYGDSSGGHIVQTATSSADPSLYVQRVSTSTSAWGAWAQPIKDLRDGLADKAAASAVESLTTRVTTAEGKISTEATKLSTLTTTVGGHTTSIQTQTTTINGIQAKNTVKINNNGFISGYGLISTSNNGAVVSAFKVDADAFAVGKSGTGILPFVVTTAGQTINGIKYPAAGTWINAAYIASATIGTAHITDLAVKTAKIDDLAVTEGKIANLSVDTLKIKDNAVTVPVGVTWGEISRVPDFTNKLLDEAAIQSWFSWSANNDFASITINRTGGKVAVSGGLVLDDFGVFAYRDGKAHAQIGSIVSLIVGVFRNGTEVARHFLAPTSVNGYSVKFSGSYTIPTFIDGSSATGNTTYTLKVAIGRNRNSITGIDASYVKSGTGVTVPMVFSSRSMLVLELKK